MIKGIGKFIKTGVKLGKPFALKAAEEAIENSGVPGANIALDIAKPFLPGWMTSEKPEAVVAGMKDLKDEDYNKLAELLVDVIALSELAAQARMDGIITEEETEAVFEAINELRVEAEEVVMAI
jgi:hypothetical protein